MCCFEEHESEECKKQDDSVTDNEGFEIFFAG